MLPHVTSAVAFHTTPKKIDPVITEPGADIIQIIHREDVVIFRQVRALLERVTKLFDRNRLETSRSGNTALFSLAELKGGLIARAR